MSPTFILGIIDIDCWKKYIFFTFKTEKKSFIL